MTRAKSTTSVLAALCLAHSVSAQYYYYGDNGVSYGVRIAIGVAVAVGVALIILLVGFIIRKRRAKAFKQAYPVQQYNPNVAQSGNNNNNTSYPPYTGAGYQPQPSYQQSPPYANYGPGANGYNPQYSSGDSPYPPPPGAPPNDGNQSYFAPPDGPPPSHPSSGAKV